MRYLRTLKYWAKVSEIYLTKNGCFSKWYLFSNPSLYPLKLSSQRSKLIERFNFGNPTVYLKEILIFILRFGRAICFLTVSIFRSRFRNFTLKTNPEGLIVSHLGSLKHDKFSCPYLGHLATAMEDNNIKTDMVFIDHVNTNDSDLKLNKTGSFFTELTVFSFAFREALIVLKYLQTDIKFSLFLLKGCFTNGQLDSIRIAVNISNFVKQNPSINFILHTFEGHAWEQTMINFLRQSGSKINFVAYQQAPINKTSRAVLDLGLLFSNPDQILCSGKAAAQLFSFESKSAEPLVIGTNRGLKKEIAPRMDDKKLKILVVPEGIYEELEPFLTYISQAVKNESSFQFVFTLHATMDKGIFWNSVEKFKLNQHIVISKDSLKKAASNCSCVLYRGSTAVVAAVEEGCIPIFIKDKKRTSIDMYAETEFNSVASADGSELKNLMKRNFDKEKFSAATNFLFQSFDAKLIGKMKI